jgi:hypothetical protein
MMNATVIRTTRAVYSDPYNTQSFFVGPGTRCFVNPITYKPDVNGNIVKRVIFDKNLPTELRTVEAVLEDGRKVMIDYLLPESQVSSFRTIIFDRI